MLVAVFEFDCEAIAAAGYDPDRNDMNATAVNGDPLAVINLGLDFDHTTRVADELRTPPPVEFSIVATLDGTLVHSDIGSTRGMDTHCDIARVVQSMAASEHGADRVSFQADSTSTGGRWDLKPAHETIDRTVRGAIHVVDAGSFPA